MTIEGTTEKIQYKESRVIVRATAQWIINECKMCMKIYAKHFLQAAATTLELYDDQRGLLSQVSYKLMDEIDKS